MIEAAARNPGLKAVVSEGAGIRSVREALLRRGPSPLERALQYPAGPRADRRRSGCSAARPSRCRSRAPALLIGPRAVFFIYGGDGQEVEKAVNPVYYEPPSRPRPSGRCRARGTPGHPDAARGVRAAGRGLLRQDAAGPRSDGRVRAGAGAAGERVTSRAALQPAAEVADRVEAGVREPRREDAAGAQPQPAEERAGDAGGEDDEGDRAGLQQQAAGGRRRAGLCPGCSASAARATGRTRRAQRDGDPRPVALQEEAEQRAAEDELLGHRGAEGDAQQERVDRLGGARVDDGRVAEEVARPREGEAERDGGGDGDEGDRRA